LLEEEQRQESLQGRLIIVMVQIRLRDCMENIVIVGCWFLLVIKHGINNATINLKPAGEGGGRAWGGDLIVIVGPGVGLLTDLAFAGEGIFEIVFAQRGSV